MLSRAPPRLRPKTIFSSSYPPIFPWVTTESFLADRPGGFPQNSEPAPVRLVLFEQRSRTKRLPELKRCIRDSRTGRPLAGTDPIPLWVRQMPVLVAYYV